MPTFPSTGIYEPNYVFSEIVNVRTNIVPMDSGKEVRYSHGTQRREFTLVFKQTDETLKDVLVAFYTARTGSLNTFSWVNPNDNKSYTVRFKDNSLQVDCIDYQIYNITLLFLEVI